MENQPSNVSMVSTTRHNEEEKMQKEVDDLVSYIKTEDPESCINILFVLQHETDANMK
jgi:hypothetical protein